MSDSISYTLNPIAVYSTSKGIPSTVTERVSIDGVSTGSDAGISWGILSTSGNPELTLADSESGKL